MFGLSLPVDFANLRNLFCRKGREETLYAGQRMLSTAVEENPEELISLRVGRLGRR